MELQRVLAKDSRAAMDQVHKLYGQDALVISNKRAKNKTELIVAVDLKSGADEALEEIQVQTKNSSHKRMTAPITSFDEVMESKIFATEDVSKDNENSIENLENDNSKNIEEAEMREAKEIVSLVKSELSIMRREILLAQQLTTWPGIEVVSHKVQPLIKALSETSISLSLKTLITSVISDTTNIEDAIEKITEIVSANFESVELLENMSGYHLFAGSPGVGKTSMIAKLALTKAAEIGEANVAIVSLRDNKIGAWNQIQLLSGQVGVESYKANNEESLKIILQELSNKKLVLIDTSGAESLFVNSLKVQNIDLKKHLIISADCSEAAIARYFENHETWNSLLISKYSETVSVWPVINALMNKSTPLSIANENVDLQTPLKNLKIRDLVVKNLKNMQLSLV